MFWKETVEPTELVILCLSSCKPSFHHLLQKEACSQCVALTDLINLTEQGLSVLDLNFPPNSTPVDALCWNECYGVIESGFCQHVIFVRGRWIKPHLSMQDHDRLTPTERKIPPGLKTLAAGWQSGQPGSFQPSSCAEAWLRCCRSCTGKLLPGWRCQPKR